MEFQVIIERALEIRKHSTAKETQMYSSAWTSEEIALGFVGDVGDLAKLIVAENGKRDIPESKEKLAHELGDYLQSVIVLANRHGVNLEEAFISTMNELETHLAKG